MLLLFCSFFTVNDVVLSDAVSTYVTMKIEQTQVEGKETFFLAGCLSFAELTKDKNVSKKSCIQLQR